MERALPAEFVDALHSLDAAGGARVRHSLRWLGDVGSPRSFRQRVRDMGAGWVFIFGLFGLLDRLFRLGRRKQQEGEQDWDGDRMGVVDVRHRRSLLATPYFLTLEKDGQEWTSWSGRPLAELPERPAKALGPLWLFDLLRGVTGAEPFDAGGATTDAVCLVVAADLGRAVAATGADAALPPGATYGDLNHLPLRVWIRRDDHCFQRISYRDPDGLREATMDLRSFGDQDDVEWGSDRIPSLPQPFQPVG